MATIAKSRWLAKARLAPRDADGSLDAQDSPHWKAALIDAAEALLTEIGMHPGIAGSVGAEGRSQQSNARSVTLGGSHCKKSSTIQMRRTTFS